MRPLTHLEEYSPMHGAGAGREEILDHYRLANIQTKTQAKHQSFVMVRNRTEWTHLRFPYFDLLFKLSRLQSGSHCETFRCVYWLGNELWRIDLTAKISLPLKVWIWKYISRLRSCRPEDTGHVSNWSNTRDIRLALHETEIKIQTKTGLDIEYWLFIGVSGCGSESQWCQVTNVWIKQWPHSPVLSPAHFEQTTKMINILQPQNNEIHKILLRFLKTSWQGQKLAETLLLCCMLL